MDGILSLEKYIELWDGDVVRAWIERKTDIMNRRFKELKPIEQAHYYIMCDYMGF